MAFGTFGASTTPNFRKNILDTNNEDPYDIAKKPLFQQATQAISGQLAGQTPQFDIQANEARDAFKSAQAQQAKATRENLLQSGFKDTGKYVEQGLIAPEREKVRQQMVLERGLTSDRATKAQEQVQAGLQNTQGLLGLQQQEAMQKAQIGSTEKIAFAGLNMEEKKLAQNAMQFTDRLAFDKWATQAGLDDKQKDRIWNGAENEKNRLQQTTMQEREIGARANLQKDQNTWQGVQNDLGRELDKEGLSLKEKELAQQASQFSSKQDFDKWALEQGINNDVAGRVWQSSENALGRAQEASLTREKFTQESNMLDKQINASASEKLLDRAMTKEIEAGRMTLEDKKLTQQANQFKTEQDFKEQMRKDGIDENTANRIWQTNERVQTGIHQELMQDLGAKLQQKGISLEVAMNNIQSQYGDNPVKAAEMMKAILKDNGVDISSYENTANTAIQENPALSQTTYKPLSITEVLPNDPNTKVSFDNGATKEVVKYSITPTSQNVGDNNKSEGIGKTIINSGQGYKDYQDGDTFVLNDVMPRSGASNLPQGIYKVTTEIIEKTNAANQKIQVKVPTVIDQFGNKYISGKSVPETNLRVLQQYGYTGK